MNGSAQTEPIWYIAETRPAQMPLLVPMKDSVRFKEAERVKYTMEMIQEVVVSCQPIE